LALWAWKTEWRDEDGPNRGTRNRRKAPRKTKIILKYLSAEKKDIENLILDKNTEKLHVESGI
jgi:hypothetical protein